MNLNSIKFKDENIFVEEVQDTIRQIGVDSLMAASLQEIIDFLIDVSVFKDEESIKAFLIHNSLESILKQQYDFPINIKINEDELDNGCIYYREASI